MAFSLSFDLIISSVRWHSALPFWLFNIILFTPSTLYISANIGLNYIMVCHSDQWSHVCLTLVKTAKAAERYKRGLGFSWGAAGRNKQFKRKKKLENVSELNATLTLQRERCWNDWSTAPCGAAMGVLKLSHGIMHILLGNSLYESRLWGAFRRCCAMPCYA